MALCHFCGRFDFKNAQAVRAHLRWCEAYQDREAEEQVYQAVRSMGMIRAPAGATEAQLRARYVAEQVERGNRTPPRALCSFCGRADFTNAQAVRAHLQRCEAYPSHRRQRRRRRRQRPSTPKSAGPT